MIIETVYFDGDWVALVKVQNELTGNYITSVRQIRGAYGEEFIRHDGNRVDVHRELEKAKRELDDIGRLRERNRKLERFVYEGGAEARRKAY